MQTSHDFDTNLLRRPWNKGKLIGQKPPLQPKHVWAIRTRLQLAERKRDLVLFDLAIDSKLRGCDLVNLKVEAVAPHAIERATVRQKKTGHPVRSSLLSKLAKRWIGCAPGLSEEIRTRDRSVTVVPNVVRGDEPRIPL